MLERLEKAGLSIKLSKCHFCETEIPFLGYLVSPQGVKPNPQKVAAVQHYPTPTNVKDVQSFLGLAQYYRKFVKDFSIKAKPLTMLTGKSVDWAWGVPQQTAFDQLRNALSQSPILAHPDFRLPFILQTDASRQGLGAVLAQRDSQGQERVIQYLSRSLSKAERNYGVTKLELLGILWALEVCRPYLQGAKFTVETDHKALQWVKSTKKNEGQMARWALRMQEFLPFDIVHKKGVQNTNADALSRSPQTQVEYEVKRLEYDDLFYIPDDDTMDADYMDRDRTKNAQDQDPFLKDISEYINDPIRYQTDKPAKARITAPYAKHYVKVDNILYRVEGKARKLAIPQDMVEEMLHLSHNTALGGHLGILKTMKRISKYLHWPKMKADVSRWIAACMHCRLRKTPASNHVGKLQPILPTRPWQIVHMDFRGPLPISAKGNRYIIAFIDAFTHWIEAKPIAKADAKTTADAFFECVIARHSCPETIMTDNGKQFTSAVFRHLSTRFGILHLLTTFYHPQTNGRIERFYRFLNETVAVFQLDTREDWEELLPVVLMAYRMNEVRTIGTSPYRMLHGRDPTLPTDKIFGAQSVPEDAKTYRETLPARLQGVWDQAIDVMQKVAEDTKLTYDSTHKDVEYKAGDKVCILRPPKVEKGTTIKFLPRWKGPCEVLRQISRLNYRVKNLVSGDESTVHVQHMQRYHPWSDESLRTLVTKAQAENAERKANKCRKRRIDEVDSDADDKESDQEDEDDEGASTLCSGDATKTAMIQKDSYVIVNTEPTDFWPHPWTLARVVSIPKGRKTLNVHWYATYAKSKPWQSQMKPGYQDHRDQRNYFQTKPMSKHDKQWISQINMSQVRIWGITHFEESGYLGSAVKRLVESDEVIQSNVSHVQTLSYKHRAWTMLDEKQTRKFGPDSSSAMRIWLAICRFTSDTNRFTSWSSENHCTLYTRVQNCIGWMCTPNKDVTERFRNDFLPGMQDSTRLIQTMLTDMLCHKYLVLRIYDTKLCWSFKRNLSRNTFVIPAYEFVIQGTVVSSGPFTLTQRHSNPNMDTNNGLIGPCRKVEKGETAKRRGAAPIPPVLSQNHRATCPRPSIKRLNRGKSR